MPEFLKAIFGSKKVGALILGLLSAVFTDPQVGSAIMNAVIAYIIAQGGVDIGLALKGKKEK